ncbi:MAG: LIC12162 family protein [Gallionella sp.]
MPNIPRYLITTADERTWKFDRPVIFLGEWCRIYDRKHIWQDMDAIVAAPYGLGQTQKDADHAEARNLEEKLFPILCDSLNHHHGTQHGARFWRIVFGHWLRRYVDVILNRVKTLELCLQTYQLSGTTAFSGDRYALAPLDSYAAVWAFNDDRWNNALYVRILSLLGEVSCPVEVVAGDASQGFSWRATETAGPLKRRILKWGYHQVCKLAGFLSRENDAFIINSYLPKKEEIKLQLALGQVPQLWASPQLETTIKPDWALRQSLSEHITGISSDTRFAVTRSLVFEILPVCYLEGFAELTEKVQQLPWPKRPKFIFTSNNFDTDDVFKLWAAMKVESGFKYVAGQHGNNYGTYRYMNPSIEERTVDKFLTWGWTDGLPQHTPTFILKTAGCKAEAHNPNGGLLLIEDMRYQSLDTWDRTQEFETYFVDQVAFAEKLQKPPRQYLTVRVHPAYICLKSFEVARWRDFDPGLKIETGVLSIQKLVDQSRLIIHSYDSTGILETLSQNIPTLAFWQNNLDHLRDSAKPYYQLLVDAGIVHLTAESVAAKVNEVWDDVEGWWKQSAIQEARKQFCDRYARVSQNPARDLKELLQK